MDTRSTRIASATAIAIGTPVPWQPPDASSPARLGLHAGPGPPPDASTLARRAPPS